MNHVSSGQAFRVWLLLISATLCTGWLAEHYGFAGRWTAAAVMLVAAIKVRLVMIHFMELRQTPRHWRLAFDAWIVIVVSIILILYYNSPAG